MDAGRILENLPATWRDRLRVRSQVDSTQGELLACCGQWPDRSVVLSDWQLQGRGRRGRAWVSPRGASLALSMLAHRSSAGYWPPALTLALGVATVEALQSLGVSAAGLKWPNDLCTAQGKLGGILVESCANGVVAGVGINLALPPEVRDAIDQPCVDLAQLGWRGRVEVLAAALIAAWDRMFNEVADGGIEAALQRWTDFDVLRGCRIHAHIGDRVLDGVARGIDAQGHLQVECATGTLALASAEVSVRVA